MIEQWKDIPGYEGLYQASTEGRIRTAPGKTTRTDRHGDRHWKTRILKGRGDNIRTGKRVSLWKDGKCKDWLQARLVALTWAPGFTEGMTVNHINGNRLDNRVCNLEWLTLGDNIRHGFETGLYQKTQKEVTLKSPDGAILFFPSRAEACRYLGVSHSVVSCAILKNRKTIKGFEIVT